MTLHRGARGELLAAEDPEGRELSFHYQGARLLTGATGPDGSSSEFAYDDAGRPRAIIDPVGDTMLYAYQEDFSALDWCQDANGNLTDHEVDTRGNVTDIIYPDGSCKSYEYDEVGDMVNCTTRRGETLTVGHDDLGRLTSVGYPDGRTVTYTYDARGNLIVASFGTG